MKIAISGTHCMGKSTYVQDFLKKWPSYKTPEKSYRDYILEKNLPHSKEATEDSQKIQNSPTHTIPSKVTDDATKKQIRHNQTNI